MNIWKIDQTFTKKTSVPPSQTSYHQAVWEGSNTATALLPWTLAKIGSKYFFLKQSLFPLLSTVVLSSFAMLSFMVLYFSSKNTSSSKQKDKTQVPPDQTPSPECRSRARQGQCWSAGDWNHGLRLGPERQCVSSQPVLNLHLGPLCFGQILLLMLIAAMGLWAKPNKQLYVFPVNKPDSFFFFSCYSDATRMQA